ncbi:hypothetical protein IE077_000805, partial [Cardiosporidium cionae]
VIFLLREKSSEVSVSGKRPLDTPYLSLVDAFPVSISLNFTTPPACLTVDILLKEVVALYLSPVLLSALQFCLTDISGWMPPKEDISSLPHISFVSGGTFLPFPCTPSFLLEEMNTFQVMLSFTARELDTFLIPRNPPLPLPSSFSSIPSLARPQTPPVGVWRTKETATSLSSSLCPAASHEKKKEEEIQRKVSRKIMECHDLRQISCLLEYKTCCWLQNHTCHTLVYSVWRNQRWKGGILPAKGEALLLQFHHIQKLQLIVPDFPAANRLIYSPYSSTLTSFSFHPSHLTLLQHSLDDRSLITVGCPLRVYSRLSHPIEIIFLAESPAYPDWQCAVQPNQTLAIPLPVSSFCVSLIVKLRSESGPVWTASCNYRMPLSCAILSACVSSKRSFVCGLKCKRIEKNTATLLTFFEPITLINALPRAIHFSVSQDYPSREVSFSLKSATRQGVTVFDWNKPLAVCLRLSESLPWSESVEITLPALPASHPPTPVATVSSRASPSSRGDGGSIGVPLSTFSSSTPFPALFHCQRSSRKPRGLPSASHVSSLSSDSFFPSMTSPFHPYSLIAISSRRKKGILPFLRSPRQGRGQRHGSPSKRHFPSKERGVRTRIAFPPPPLLLSPPCSSSSHSSHRRHYRTLPSPPLERNTYASLSSSPPSSSISSPFSKQALSPLGISPCAQIAASPPAAASGETFPSPSPLYPPTSTGKEKLLHVAVIACETAEGSTLTLHLRLQFDGYVLTLVATCLYWILNLTPLPLTYIPTQMDPPNVSPQTCIEIPPCPSYISTPSDLPPSSPPSSPKRSLSPQNRVPPSSPSEILHDRDALSPYPSLKGIPILYSHQHEGYVLRSPAFPPTRFVYLQTFDPSPSLFEADVDMLEGLASPSAPLLDLILKPGLEIQQLLARADPAFDGVMLIIFKPKQVVLNLCPFPIELQHPLSSEGGKEGTSTLPFPPLRLPSKRFWQWQWQPSNGPRVMCARRLSTLSCLASSSLDVQPPCGPTSAFE